MSNIKIDGLGKVYRLGTINYGSLAHDLQSYWAKIRGKEDPNAKVFDHKRLSGSLFKALDDVSFEIKRGERIGIIGSNGAGKSTLLKILSRVTGPTSGKIRIKGKVASLLEVGTGFHPELTGRENIFLNGAILGMGKSEITRKFDEIVDFSGVSDFIDTPVKRYSSGMYVRLAFAVAAHLEPDIMIVDEVLAVGDAAFQKKCLGKMQEVGSGGERIVIFVSHNMDAIRQLCTRGIVLSEGRLVYDGETRGAVDVYLDKLKEQLNVSSSLAKEVHFESDLRYPNQITKFSILGGSEGNRFDINDFIEFEIEYRVNGRISNLIADLRIFRDADCILLSCVGDEDSSLREEHKPGKYIAKVRIPKKFLPAGNYIAKSRLHVPPIHPEGIYEPPTGLMFSVHVDGLILKNQSYLPAWSGKVLTHEPWQVSYEPSAK
ncbi:hypothetical protein CH373_12195 [Leptospira perolatii]|uniref:ABC transporter domain-containing protein n=1 Tax=Leptospira perolatii TaxID=2023191 RepID=A0A2M9ZL86_9LEPT|nr:ABC transporter ATP-binding protein [Leptospira perolatii]PJZ70299.1 hypothetical protein CH360_06775 [Leptospira perolatii]PJZ72817.1 hypothetical protein CH373_12195 [Leptospira perolatii]